VPAGSRAVGAGVVLAENGDVHFRKLGSRNYEGAIVFGLLNQFLPNRCYCLLTF
jgi:hypothetical protein